MRKIGVWLFGFAAVIACSWALFHSGFFRVHDYVHAARIAEMLRALQDGHFPVRWTRDFGFGYGMPLFEFYAPLPYYTGALIYWLGFDIIFVIKFLFLLCSVMTFVGMYLLGSKLFGRAGGILSAVALTVAPYRAVNLFVRGALSEAWGIMAIPWVLLGMVKVLRREKNGWVVLFFGYVMLFLSHNITTLLFFPVSAMFGVGYWMYLQFAPHKKAKALIQVANRIAPIFLLGLTFMLAVGFCAFYLFPAYLEKDLTRVNLIFTGYFHYTNHFLYVRQFFEDRWGYGGSAIWPFNGLSYFLGYGQLLGFGVTTLLIVKAAWSAFRKKTGRAQLLRSIFLYMVFFVAMLFTMFMMSFKSQFIWDALPFMVAVQFPWRFLSSTSVLLALLVGLSTVFIQSRWRKYAYVTVLAIFTMLTNFYYFRPEFYLSDPEKFYYTDQRLIRIYMSQVLNDYVPKQIAFLPEPVHQVASTKSKYGKVKVLMDRTQEKLIQTNFSEPNEEIEVFIADFPGWRLYVDGVEAERKVGPNGDYLVHVPAGEHLVSALFTDSLIRLYSDIASGISVVVVLFLLIGTQYQKRYNQTYDA